MTNIFMGVVDQYQRLSDYLVYCSLSLHHGDMICCLFMFHVCIISQAKRLCDT